IEQFAFGKARRIGPEISGPALQYLARAFPGDWPWLGESGRVERDRGGAPAESAHRYQSHSQRKVMADLPTPAAKAPPPAEASAPRVKLSPDQAELKSRESVWHLRGGRAGKPGPRRAVFFCGFYSC